MGLAASAPRAGHQALVRAHSQHVVDPRHDAGNRREHLLGEIKQRFPDILMMMVTAYADDERRRRASDLGACEFLTEPVDLGALEAPLRQFPGAL